MLQLVDYHFN